MKKIIFGFSLLLISTFLYACGSDKDTQTEKSTTSVTKEVKKEQSEEMEQSQSSTEQEDSTSSGSTEAKQVKGSEGSQQESLNGSWLMVEEGISNELNISDATNTAFNFSIYSSYDGAAGEIEGTAMVNGNTAISHIKVDGEPLFPDAGDSCILSFNLDSNSIYIEETNPNCLYFHGQKAGFGGTYQKDGLKQTPNQSESTEEKQLESENSGTTKTDEQEKGISEEKMLFEAEKLGVELYKAMVYGDIETLDSLLDDNFQIINSYTVEHNESGEQTFSSLQTDEHKDGSTYFEKNRVYGANETYNSFTMVFLYGLPDEGGSELHINYTKDEHGLLVIEDFYFDA